MAELNFNAQQFQSQQIPDQLPSLSAAPAPTSAPQAAPQHTAAVSGFWSTTQQPQQQQAEEPLTAEQQAMLGHTSQWVGLMDTPHKVLQHCLVERQTALYNAEQAAKQAEHQLKDPAAREAAKRAKDAHANVVKAANDAWRDAIRQRSVAMKQWDQYVAEKHAEFTRLKAQRG